MLRHPIWGWPYRFAEVLSAVPPPRPAGLEICPARAYDLPMSLPARPLPDLEDDEAAELVALTAAVAEADADPRGIPHEEM